MPARIGSDTVIEFNSLGIYFNPMLMMGGDPTLFPLLSSTLPYPTTTGAGAFGLATPSGHQRVSYSDQMSRT